MTGGGEVSESIPILVQVNYVVERYEEDSGLRGSGDPEAGAPWLQWINDILARYLKPRRRVEGERVMPQ